MIGDRFVVVEMTLRTDSFDSHALTDWFGNLSKVLKIWVTRNWPALHRLHRGCWALRAAGGLGGWGLRLLKRLKSRLGCGWRSLVVRLVSLLCSILAQATLSFHYSFLLLRDFFKYFFFFCEWCSWCGWGWAHVRAPLYSERDAGQATHSLLPTHNWCSNCCWMMRCCRGSTCHSFVPISGPPARVMQVLCTFFISDNLDALDVGGVGYIDRTRNLFEVFVKLSEKWSRFGDTLTFVSCWICSVNISVNLYFRLNIDIL